MIRSGVVASAVAVVLVSVAPPSRAADDDEKRALAAPLFDEGVTQMDEAHCDAEPILPADRPKCREALDKFRRAFAIYPDGLGALRNAAICERGLGLVASAMRDFREVARRAPLDPNPSKQLWAKHASDEADKLSKRVPHVTVRVAMQPAPDFLVVSLDDRSLDPAALGVALAVDPGEHTVRARAPSHEPFVRAFSVEEKEDATIEVTLAPTKVEPPPPPPPPPVVHPPIVPTIVVVGGAAAIVGGLTLGWLAKSERDRSCDVDVSPIACRDPSGLDRARHLATASTILTAAGAGLAVVGSVWFALDVNAQRSVRAGAVGGPGVAGLAIQGAF